MNPPTPTYEAVCLEIGDEPIRWFVAIRQIPKGFLLTMEEAGSKEEALLRIVNLEDKEQNP